MAAACLTVGEVSAQPYSVLLAGFEARQETGTFVSQSFSGQSLNDPFLGHGGRRRRELQDHERLEDDVFLRRHSCLPQDTGRLCALLSSPTTVKTTARDDSLTNQIGSPPTNETSRAWRISRTHVEC